MKAQNSHSDLENGEKIEYFHDSGQLRIEIYVLRDSVFCLHNINGPAYRSWHEDGALNNVKYYLMGRPLTKEEWEEEIHKTRFSTALNDLLI